ncbi:hypothetical protein AB0I82_35450 [Streptomyces sp. NPDC050315]|uniref:hypothetical protein n=1 Tax=Streptomyces sp. NPDC050315 TaxID=3155039 RepID=UPI003416F389
MGGFFACFAIGGGIIALMAPDSADTGSDYPTRYALKTPKTLGAGKYVLKKPMVAMEV